ncbi:MAG: ATP-binding protein [candidate division Zixibacteria bacterium]|jgi:anti-sigma regulatory factor (Ser/Thr protein kinase)|nr:ATP-binding protein [candidate division Zixibacteria bacterium]
MSDIIKISLTNTAFNLSAAEEIFSALARAATPDIHKQYHIRTVLSEVYGNAYLYSNKTRPNSVIDLEVCFTPNRFTASIINEGRGPADINSRKVETIPAYAESGRGLAIVRKLCDNVYFKKISETKFGVFFEIELPSVRKIKNI